MLAPIVKTLTSRTAGPVASSVAAALAVLLVVSWSSAAHTKAELQGRIAELSHQANTTVTFASTDVGPAGLERASAEPAQAAIPGTLGDKTAERLLREPPVGFDDCARMQAADEAVLASLK